MNFPKNKYLTSMCKSSGEADPLRAVAIYVDEHRKPGMTLAELAKILGVSAIIEEKLPFEGGVFAEGDRLIIKVNSSSVPVRRRFTIAHELGHLIISPGNAQSARRCLASNPLERACDCVAAELLMPFHEAMGSVEGRASMFALLSFADRFKVSLHAAAVRIKELEVWKESVGLWKWNGAAEQLWYVGKRLWIDQQLLAPAFERAIHSTTVVETDVLYSDTKGPHMAYLKIQRLGKDHILAFVLA
jgi:Zn-dependent peptidase ImmA (M78 family)